MDGFSLLNQSKLVTPFAGETITIPTIFSAQILQISFNLYNTYSCDGRYTEHEHWTEYYWYMNVDWSGTVSLSCVNFSKQVESMYGFSSYYVQFDRVLWNTPFSSCDVGSTGATRYSGKSLVLMPDTTILKTAKIATIYSDGSAIDVPHHDHIEVTAHTSIELPADGTIREHSRLGITAPWYPASASRQYNDPVLTDSQVASYCDIRPSSHSSAHSYAFDANSLVIRVNI